MKTTEAIDRVYRRIEDPKSWCQGPPMVNSNGDAVESRKYAVAWCVFGAFVMEGEEVKARFRVVNSAAKSRHGMTLIDVNENLGHAAVLDALTFARAHFAALND